MNKVICEVCGTKYPDSAEQCPICGNIRQAAQTQDAETVPAEEELVNERPVVRGGRFSKANVRKRNKNLPVYEEEEVEEQEPAPTYEENVYEEFEPREKSGTLLNVFLVIVIVSLLAVTAYIGFEYVLPNLLPAETEPTVATEMPTEEPTEAPTEEPTVPCQDLIFEENLVLFEEQGQQWMMNIQALPADTTDVLYYVSSDETVVTVDAEGVITAVGEGDAVVTAVCGKLSVECTIACAFDSSEEEPTEEPAEEPVDESTEEPAEEPTEEPTEAPTEGPTEPLKDVELKIKGVPDLTFRQQGQTHQVKMDCELEASEATWTSENEKVATVDKNGVITRTGKGKTTVTVQYGDQKIEIIVRCP